MFVKALRIALSKSASDAAPLLERALAGAELLARLEGDFESRINANKAGRGEKPTRLSGARRSEIDEYAADAAAIEMQQLAAFESDCSATEIVEVLKAGLDSDLRFWSTAAKHAHPADRPLVQELVKAKISLQASLASCLPEGPTGAA